MGTLGNSPRQRTVLTLEARTSFAFGVKFFNRVDNTAVDLTGATVRLMAAYPARFGGGNAIYLVAEPVGDPALGIVQFNLQDTQLDLPPGEYEFSVTLVTMVGYSTPVLKGAIEIVANSDTGFLMNYPGISPSTNLAAYVENGQVIEVTVDQVDGLATVINQMVSHVDDLVETVHQGVQSAEGARDEAQVFSEAASLSAGMAELHEENSGLSAAAASDSAAQANDRQQLAQNAANLAAQSAAAALAYLFGMGTAVQAASASAAAAAASAAAAQAAADAVESGVLDIQSLVDEGSFTLEGTWDFTLANVIGLAAGGPSLPEGTQFLLLDVDGVPYYDAAATTPSLALLLDVDATPYYAEL